MRRIAFMCGFRPANAMDPEISANIIPENVGTMARAMAAAGYSVDIYVDMEGIKRFEAILWAPQIRLIYIPENKCVKTESELHAAVKAEDILQHIFSEQLVYDLFQSGSLFWTLVATQIKKVTGTPVIMCLNHPGRDAARNQTNPLECFGRQHAQDPFTFPDIDWLILAGWGSQAELLRIYSLQSARITMLPPGSCSRQAKRLESVYLQVESNCRNKRHGNGNFDLAPIRPMVKAISPTPAKTNNGIATHASSTLRKLLSLAFSKPTERKYG